jgi:dimethylargininase
MPLVTPTHALVRPISASYDACIRDDATASIDVALARTQHTAYVDALRSAGIHVEILPALPDAPDAVFVEDTAVILDSVALVTRPGARARRAEVASVASALDGRRALTIMAPPGTLDGGDVMRVGSRLVVGLSQRTDQAGADALAVVAAKDRIDVVTVALPGGLHLKSACSVARPGLVVAYGPLAPALRGVLDPEIEILEVPEPAGANVLGFADRVLVSSAAPRTAALLEARGLSVRTLDLSQIHLGDGALSCLSLRLVKWTGSPSDEWCV